MDLRIKECLSNDSNDQSAIRRSLEAETIEVVPEIIPFSDSDDCDDDDDNNDDHNDMDDMDDVKSENDEFGNFYDYNDNEQKDFNEFGYRVNQFMKSIYEKHIAKSKLIQRNAQSNEVIAIEDATVNDVKNDGPTGCDKRIYECDICSRKVASSYNLKRHMMIHTGEKPYGCDICNRRFREFSDLKKHRRVHSTEKQFKCMICHRNTPSIANPTKCSTCESNENAQKSNELTVDRIIRRIDGTKRSFVCHFCDRPFGSSSNLKRHIMIHTGEKPFNCKICHKSFREMSTLKKHSFTHRNVSMRPSIAETVISKKEELSFSHRETFAHLPEITVQPVQSVASKIYHHKCPKCSEIFNNSNELMLHVCRAHQVNDKTTTTTTATHSQVKLRKATLSPPPLIPINRKAFASRTRNQSNFDATIGTAVPQFFCKICCKKFRSQQHLSSHQLTHESDL